MWSGVMVEFGRREELYPFGWVIGAEDVEIGLKFLIGLFCLSIGLWVIGSGKSYIIFEEASKLSCKGRCKLRSPIQDDSVMKTKVFEYKLKK